MDALKKHILILEEQKPIRLLLAEMVERLGCEVVGPAKNIPEALALVAGNELDAAILDVKIDGKPTIAVSEELSRKGIPFAFASGNTTLESAKRFAPAPVITKPYSAAQIKKMLGKLIPPARGGGISA